LSGVVSSRYSSLVLGFMLDTGFFLRILVSGSLMACKARRARRIVPVTTRANTRPIMTAIVASFFTFILSVV